MTDKIEDRDEVMFRQVHPDFIQQGEPSSCRFRPQSNDDGKLSVDRGSLTTAPHPMRFTQALGSSLLLCSAFRWVSLGIMM